MKYVWFGVIRFPSRIGYLMTREKPRRYSQKEAFQLMNKRHQLAEPTCWKGKGTALPDHIISVDPPNGPSSERIPGSLLPKSQRGNVFSLRKLPVPPSSSTRHIHLSLCLKCPGLKEQSRGHVLNLMTLCIQATSDRDSQWTSGPGQPIHSLIWPGADGCVPWTNYPLSQLDSFS